MANCLGGQYGGGILRYVPKIRTPSLRLYNKRQMQIGKGQISMLELAGLMIYPYHHLHLLV